MLTCSSIDSTVYSEGDVKYITIKAFQRISLDNVKITSRVILIRVTASITLQHVISQCVLPSRSMSGYKNGCRACITTRALASDNREEGKRRANSNQKTTTDSLK